jgi:hypothetical protein
VIAVALGDGFGGTRSKYEEIFILSSSFMKIFDSTRCRQAEIFIFLVTGLKILTPPRGSNPPNYEGGGLALLRKMPMLTWEV